MTPIGSATEYEQIVSNLKILSFVCYYESLRIDKQVVVKLVFFIKFNAVSSFNSSKIIYIQFIALNCYNSEFNMHFVQNYTKPS